MALNFEVVSEPDFLRKYRECVESREKSGMIRTLAELTGGSSKEVVSQLISMGVKREELPGTVLRYLSPEQEELLRQNEEQKAAEPVQTKCQYADVPDCRDKSSVFEDLPAPKHEKLIIYKKDPVEQDPECGLPFTTPEEKIDEPVNVQPLPEVIIEAIHERLGSLEQEIAREKASLISIERQMELCAGRIKTLEDKRSELCAYV